MKRSSFGLRTFWGTALIMLARARRLIARQFEVLKEHLKETLGA